MFEEVITYYHKPQARLNFDRLPRIFGGKIFNRVIRFAFSAIEINDLPRTTL